MQSIFTDKKATPTDTDLKKAIGTTYTIWQTIAEYARSLYPSATEAWHHSGEKYGWSYRINDKKRAIVYLLPRDKFFKSALVFGQKAVNEIMGSDIAEAIKTELAEAKAYAEGRGIRIDIKDKKLVRDIKKLIEIKVKN